MQKTNEGEECYREVFGETVIEREARLAVARFKGAAPFATVSPPASQGAHVVSALYCPDGRRYEWRTDQRGAELLRRVMAEQEREFGGEWVDVRVE
jgi:hypothetical protein